MNLIAQPVGVDALFGRNVELNELQRRLRLGPSFVVYGDSGAGKTLLLRCTTNESSRFLYCPDSTTGQSVFRHLAHALLAARDPHIRRACGRYGAHKIEASTTLQLRGLVMDAIAAGHYWAVLDHLRQPSASLASDIRDMMFRGNTSVVAVARSAHMEDLGYLASFFALRSEKMHVRPFDHQLATEFVHQCANNVGLAASNREELLSRVVELAGGLPGNIVSLIRMASSPKYRTADYVMIAPLYIDFRLAWHAANAA
jgi:hypothetical protein